MNREWQSAIDELNLMLQNVIETRKYIQEAQFFRQTYPTLFPSFDDEKFNITIVTLNDYEKFLIDQMKSINTCTEELEKSE